MIEAINNIFFKVQIGHHYFKVTTAIIRISVAFVFTQKPLLSREYQKGKHLPRTCNTVAEDSQKSVVHTSSVDVGIQAEGNGYEKPHERDSVNKVPKSTTSARDTRASRPDPDVMSRLRRLEEMQHLNTVDKLKVSPVKILI